MANAPLDIAGKFKPMPELRPEVVAGSMSILRIGPVTVPLHAMVQVAMRSEMMLLLRGPRLEEQAMPGVPSACEILDIWIGDARPNFTEDQRSLGIIRPGELIQAVVMNHSTQLRGASVVVEGDAIRIVHWAVDCASKWSGGCPDCRWRTRCGHEECERSGGMETSCQRWHEEEHVRKLALSAALPPRPESKGLWRPWNPLSG